MKMNKIMFIGMFAVVAALGIGLVGCASLPKGGHESDLVGTWEGPPTSEGPFTLIFKSNQSVEMTSQNTSLIKYLYSYDGVKLTIQTVMGNPISSLMAPKIPPFVGTAKIDGNTLTLSGFDNIKNGKYTKK